LFPAAQDLKPAHYDVDMSAKSISGAVPRRLPAAMLWRPRDARPRWLVVPAYTT
jgi:hypothetical protein